MKKIFGFACFGVAIAVSVHSFPVTAQEVPSYLCESQLSFSPCSSWSKRVTPQEVNQMFIDRFKMAALSSDPLLSNEAQRYPMQQAAIKTAQAYCGALRDDLSDRVALRKAFQAYREARAGMPTLLDSSNRDAVGIAVNLAPKYYCPDL